MPRLPAVSTEMSFHEAAAYDNVARLKEYLADQDADVAATKKPRNSTCIHEAMLLVLLVLALMCLGDRVDAVVRNALSQ